MVAKVSLTVNATRVTVTRAAPGRGPGPGTQAARAPRHWPRQAGPGRSPPGRAGPVSLRVSDKFSATVTD